LKEEDFEREKKNIKVSFDQAREIFQLINQKINDGIDAKPTYYLSELWICGFQIR